MPYTLTLPDSLVEKRYEILDMRPLPLYKRGFRLCETFEAMQTPYSFVLISDDNPEKMLGCCRNEFKGRFEFTMLEEGPAEWKALVIKKYFEE